ncbi:hypothetical protein IscW_ISCW008352, partial [Ixodes scapularis]
STTSRIYTDNRPLYTNVNVKEEKKCVSDANKSQARTSVDDMLRGPIKLRLPSNKKKKESKDYRKINLRGSSYAVLIRRIIRKKNWTRKPATKKKKL